MAGGTLLQQPNVVGPFDEVREISSGLDILPSVEVLGPLLKQSIDHLLGLLFLHNGRG